MILLGLLVLVVFLIVGVLLNVAGDHAGRARQVAGLPEGTRVAASDLSGSVADLIPGTLTLRDDEFGLVGRPDLLLKSAEGVVPVEVKPAGSAWTPGRIYLGHKIQLGAYFLLCRGDRRVGQRPSEGLIRYVDAAGCQLPGGEFRVGNTEELREQVIDVLRRMRRDLRHAVVHRSHNAQARCRRCSVREACGEALA